MNSSAHIDNKKKDIFIFGKSPRQGLDYTTLTAEKEYAITFRDPKKKFCLSLYYNGANSYLFVNVVEVYKFQAKDSEINAAPLRSCNISKNFSADNMKNAASYGYVYDFLVDYDSVDVDNI